MSLKLAQASLLIQPGDIVRVRDIDGPPFKGFEGVVTATGLTGGPGQPPNYIGHELVSVLIAGWGEACYLPTELLLVTIHE